ncbi:putative metacaspase [Trifolium repens]|nr:putative metacaspase [Trifolium repens]
MTFFGFNRRDIRLMVDAYRRRYDGGRRRLRRQHLTQNHICRAILKMIADAWPEDTLLVYLSGHGGLCWPSRNNQYTNGFFVTRTGRVSDSFFRDALESLPRKCKFSLILDCCFSGSFNIGPK